MDKADGFAGGSSEKSGFGPFGDVALVAVERLIGNDQMDGMSCARILMHHVSCGRSTGDQRYQIIK